MGVDPRDPRLVPESGWGGLVRIEVRIHAAGEEVVSEVAMQRLRSLLGERDLGTQSRGCSWSTGVVIEADDLGQAAERVSVELQALAAMAGLPAFKMTSAEARGPERRHIVDGFPTSTRQVMAAIAIGTDPTSEQGGSSGVGEPRNPQPQGGRPPRGAQAEP